MTAFFVTFYSDSNSIKYRICDIFIAYPMCAISRGSAIQFALSQILFCILTLFISGARSARHLGLGVMQVRSGAWMVVWWSLSLEGMSFRQTHTLLFRLSSHYVFRFFCGLLSSLLR